MHIYFSLSTLVFTCTVVHSEYLLHNIRDRNADYQALMKVEKVLLQHGTDEELGAIRKKFSTCFAVVNKDDPEKLPVQNIRNIGTLYGQKHPSSHTFIADKTLKKRNFQYEDVTDFHKRDRDENINEILQLSTNYFDTLSNDRFTRLGGLLLKTLDASKTEQRRYFEKVIQFSERCNLANV